MIPINKIKTTNIFLFLVLGFLIVFTYWELPKTFFQQDEWYGFNIYSKREGEGNSIHFIKEVFFTFGKTHYTPLAEIGMYSQYKLFNLHFPFYAYISIIIHILNTILVFIFAKQITQSRLISFLSSLLFAINAISHQAVSWIAAGLNTQGATFFSLLFYILFFDYLKNKEKNIKTMILSFILLTIGLLFKETIAPFILAPFFYLFYSADKSILSFQKKLIPFAVFLGMYLSLRILIYLNAPPLFIGNVELVQTGALVYIYRIAVLPFRAIAQSLIPAQYLLFFSEYLIRLSYPQYSYFDGSVDPLARETLGYDLVCIIITTLVGILAFISYKYFKKRNVIFSKSIVLFLLIIIFSALLIIFVPGKAGYVSLIEPRHLYPGSFGAGGLFVLIFYGLLSFFTFDRSKKILTVIVILIVLLNIWIIKKDIYALKAISEKRKYFLTTISSLYPSLPKKVIIYTQSDKAYYGLPENEKILPVQVGFGGMLLAWYHKNEKFPSCLYDIPLFLEILGEGYKECNGRGFGYFRKKELLQKALIENKLASSNIIAFSYDSTSGIFTEITRSIRQEVSKTFPVK